MLEHDDEEGTAPSEPQTISGLLDDWDITRSELNEVLADNPSLRGMLFGYVAEVKARKAVDAFKGVTKTRKEDDHDRDNKHDLVITYKGHEITLEVKSLQTNSIKRHEQLDGTVRYTGKSQVDASDRREIHFSDGTKLNTTLLQYGDFDVLAVNIFAFEDEWRFIYARNKDLPHSTYHKYTEAQRKALIGSLVPVSWPSAPPFKQNLKEVLDEIVKERGGPRSASRG